MCYINGYYNVWSRIYNQFNQLATMLTTSMMTRGISNVMAKLRNLKMMKDTSITISTKPIKAAQPPRLFHPKNITTRSMLTTRPITKTINAKAYSKIVKEANIIFILWGGHIN